MRRTTSTYLVALAGVASLALTACGGVKDTAGGGSDSGDYPSGAVEMPVGASAGGSSDLISRQVSQGLSKDEHVARIGQERNIVDLLAQIVAWLGYCWAVGGSGNPLMQGHGIPSATLLERAHGLAGIDLSPGLPSASSCPEAIWQAARWWYKAYDPVEPSSFVEVTAGRVHSRAARI